AQEGRRIMNQPTPRATRRNVDRALSGIAQQETGAKILPFPIPAPPQTEYRTTRSSHTVTKSGKYEGCRIIGNSLSGDSIFDGDILICRAVKKGENIEGRLVMVLTPRGLLV